MAVRGVLLIVEPDRLLRVACKRLLSPLIAICAADTVAAALPHIDNARGMLLDAMLSDGTALDLLDAAVQRNKLIPSMVVTGASNRATANRAFAFGAYYCEKPVEPDILKLFVAEVHAPGTLKVMRALNVWSPRYSLTNAEARVLRLAALGHSHDVIAMKCQVARETVKTHVKALLAKTGDQSLGRAALRLLREG